MIEVFDAIEQGTPEWFAARAGLVTASKFQTVQAKGKDGGRSVTRYDYMRQLAGEILTGEPAPEGYSNAFMERGHELEDEARSYFALKRNADPHQVGFIRNGRMGCSPDSLLGENAGLEIKVAIPAVQIERLQRGELPTEHKAQVQGSMLVTGRPVWHFVSYCPKLPTLILDVPRDDEYLAQLAKAIEAFNTELDAMVDSIRTYQDFKRQAA